MPHWVWNFFATDGTNFNGSNKRVWCRAELTPVLETLIEEDQLALSRHELDSPRTEHVLIGEGEWDLRSLRNLDVDMMFEL